MGFVKGGDAAVGDPVPELNAAIFAAGDVAVGGGVVVHAADGVGVLVQRVARHKALEGVYIIEAEGWMLRPHQQIVPGRVERD